MNGAQGQGPETTEKQYALEKVLGQWLGIIGCIKAKAKAQDPKIKYSQSLREIALKSVLYVDMNAGSGWNEKVDCVGSPLLFLQEANKYDFGLDINFIEIDEGRTAELNRRLRDECQYKKLLPMCNIHTGDNYEILPELIAREKCYGLVYCDPNGPKNLRIEELARISKSPNFRFVDILIRISGTAYKRVKNGLNNFGEKKDCPHLIGKYPNLKTAIRTINKTKWLVREVQDPDPAQWTFLFGTNWPDYKEMSKEGFYDITSSRGAATFDRIAFTAPELEHFGYQEKVTSCGST